MGSVVKGTGTRLLQSSRTRTGNLCELGSFVTGTSREHTGGTTEVIQTTFPATVPVNRPFRVTTMYQNITGKWLLGDACLLISVLGIALGQAGAEGTAGVCTKTGAAKTTTYVWVGRIVGETLFDGISMSALGATGPRWRIAEEITRCGAPITSSRQLCRLTFFKNAQALCEPNGLRVLHAFGIYRMCYFSFPRSCVRWELSGNVGAPMLQLRCDIIDWNAAFGGQWIGQ